MEEVRAPINNSLNEEVKAKLTPKYYVVSPSYQLPKIHKENYPLIPIVNTMAPPQTN